MNNTHYKAQARVSPGGNMAGVQFDVPLCVAVGHMRGYIKWKPKNIRWTLPGEQAGCNHCRRHYRKLRDRNE